MQVILKQDVKKLGEKGKVVNVAEGYAQNFLFPRGLAEPMNKSNKKALETEKKDKMEKEKRLLEQAKNEALKLQEVNFVIKAKGGETGKLFGSITSADLSDMIKTRTGLNILKKDILLDEHIKTTGKYKVKIKFHPKLKTEIEFEVVKE